MKSVIFSVPTAALFVYHPQRKLLRLFVEKGRRVRERRVNGLPFLPEHIKQFRMNDPHTLRDMAESAFFVRNKEVFSDLQTTIFLPLFAKGDFVGAIALGRKLERAPFRQGEKDVLRVIAHQMAITLHNARLFLEVAKKAAENKKLYSSMQQIYQDTIQAFATAIDAKDEYTKDHSYRVASYAVAIARELGWKRKDVEAIYIAGLLHDIGKIIIDDYRRALAETALLRPGVDRFFTDVFVMVDDQRLRSSRLMLMVALRDVVLRMADISQLAAVPA